MKIVTFAAIKGGVGKTTLTFNYGEWLASHGKQVLLIDLDHQCNLSNNYGVAAITNNVGNIFDPDNQDEVKIENVKENIDLIPGDMNLDKKEVRLENNANQNMMLFFWLFKHKDQINKYDYVLIDTHPDFSIAVRNAIMISDDVLSPITPNKHGYDAKFNLQVRFDEFKKEAVDYNNLDKSMVTANLYFLANMLKKGYKSTQKLIDKLTEEAKAEGSSNCIAFIPEKELFNKEEHDLPKSISTFAENKSLYHREQQFFDDIDKTFENITNKL